MASSYLKQKESEYRIQAEQEKNQISADIQNRIWQIEKKHKQPKSMSGSIPIGCLGGLVLMAIAISAAAKDGSVMLMGLIGTIVATILVHNARKGMQYNYNQNLNSQVAALRNQEAAQHKAVDDKYAQILAQETARFQASTKASRTKYGGHTAAQPIVNWLGARFEKMIMKADRRPHNKYIEVVFAFRVDENQIATLKEIKKANGFEYANDELFDFNVNRFRNLTDFEDRVGFAQAVAKLVQFDIMRRYPKDPVSPSHSKPLVIITSDDSMMELRYQVANPAYRHAVTL